MLRVLQVVTYMGRGGLETMLMNYYRNIDREKVQFDFLVHRDFIADYDAEIEQLGGKIYRLPRLNPFSKAYLSALNQFFKEHKEYSIVHSHLDCMSAVPLKYAKKNGVPVRIAHAHNSNQTKDKNYPLKLLFKRRIVKYATYLFACGEAAGKWMFGTDKIRVINNAIDTQDYLYKEERRLDIRDKLNIKDDEKVIGHVGRFAVPKNHSFIIELFAEILKDDINYKLLLIGDGELRKDIEKKAKELGIYEKILFLGLREDVADLLQAMDVFCFPSLYEGLPVSIIEAQAAGLPCLISDKVPIACKITDLVTQISLDAEKKVWVEEIKKAVKCERRNMYKEICEANYDIKENAKKLQRFYQKKEMKRK